MLKVERKLLSKELQTELEGRQQALRQSNADENPWVTFTNEEGKNDDAGKHSIRGVLREMFHGKCAYCECDDGSQIDHHWPKSPHPKLNANRGTEAQMFQWNNLVWSCHKCNSWECKGSHMQWDATGRTMLLDPCALGDDPLCYFDIDVDASKKLDCGRIEPREGLTKAAMDRATYTITRLKLNVRDNLRSGRRRTIKRFKQLIAYVRELGPDFKAPEGRSVREDFAELLDPKEPYLAPVRQILRRDLTLREELLDRMPELGPLLDEWDLEPDDCAALMQ